MAGHKKITNDRLRGRLRRKNSIRLRITGTAEKPRLSVFRSLKHIYIQAIDDTNNQVLASVSDLHKDLQGDLEGKKKKERAAIVGEALGKKLIELNVKKAVFDRNGYQYHGRVKEVADGARKAGLEF
jgi:large subunit ribosomal protein L18